MSDPIRDWIKQDPVRIWIDRASIAWKKHRGWRKVGIGSLIVILICVFLVTAIAVLAVFLLKVLSSGSARNKDLYLPGKFINKDLYFPRRR